MCYLLFVVEKEYVFCRLYMAGVFLPLYQSLIWTYFLFHWENALIRVFNGTRWVNYFYFLFPNKHAHICGKRNGSSYLNRSHRLTERAFYHVSVWKLFITFCKPHSDTWHNVRCWRSLCWKRHRHHEWLLIRVLKKQTGDVVSQCLLQCGTKLFKAHPLGQT